MAGPIKWFDVAYQPKGWKPINIPGYWEDQGVKDLNGVVWYRKEVDLPASMSNKQARVFLGRIVDADELYINGKLVGGFTYMYPQRRYSLAAGILKPGKNLLWYGFPTLLSKAVLFQISLITFLREPILLI